jgi:cbb3-type cytochrome oxidase maturation protein
MNILLFLIPVSMAALILAAWAFVWAVRRGQFEDLDTPALDILREDEHDRPVRAPSTPTPATGDSPTTGPGQASPAVPLDRPASATAPAEPTPADPTPAATSTGTDTSGETETGSKPLDAAQTPSRDGRDG